MGINISTGVPPPDDILISVNSSTNKLQLKPGTRGDLLVAGASGVWAKTAVGASGKYLGSDGTDAAWVAAPGEGWTYIQTVTGTANDSLDTTALTAYNEYLVIFNLRATAGNHYASLRLGIGSIDTGTNYGYGYLTTTTKANATGQSVIQLTSGDETTCNYYGRLWIQGVSRNAASGKIEVACCMSGTAAVATYGYWTAGNAQQLQYIRFTTGGASSLTGSYYVYGRNFS